MTKESDYEISRRASVEEFCEGSLTYLEHLLPCCDPLATCNARASTECLLRPQPN